jgi:hypothetical protein
MRREMVLIQQADAHGHDAPASLPIRMTFQKLGASGKVKMLQLWNQKLAVV